MKPAYKANYQLWKLYVKIIYKPKLEKVQNLRIVNPPIFKCRPSWNRFQTLWLYGIFKGSSQVRYVHSQDCKRIGEKYVWCANATVVYANLHNLLTFWPIFAASWTFFAEQVFKKNSVIRC